MGLMQRVKGKRFEREIAGQLRDRYVGLLVRRASQGERADMPDVFVDGESAKERGKPILARLWLECQDSRTPTPFAKLRQAERDVAHRCIRALPIALTHKTGSREILATMRLSTVYYLEHGVTHYDALEPVTMDLGSLFAVLDRAIERGRT